MCKHWVEYIKAMHPLYLCGPLCNSQHAQGGYQSMQQHSLSKLPAYVVGGLPKHKQGSSEKYYSASTSASHPESPTRGQGVVGGENKD